MTTSNFNDLSSFEPEAILASLPGEHPKFAAALAVGREASESGHLDVAALTRIANEIYAQGFPTDSPFAGSQAELPSTASLPDASSALAPIGGVSSLFGGALPAAGGVDLSQLAQAPVKPEVPSQVAAAQAYQLQYTPDIASDIEVAGLLGGFDIPYQAELQGLLGSFGVAVPTTPTAPASIGSTPAIHSKVSENPFYFLKSSNITSGVDIAPAAHPSFDANLVRKDFPILSELVNGRPLIWLDNAATTQKPQSVIDRLVYFYQHENSNIHRAAHELAARATDAYEGAREKVRGFINAPSVDNIVFVRGTTEAINLVAKTWGKKHLREGDEIVITNLEHHANIVPWQQLCAETGAKLKVAPVDDTGQVRLDEYQRLLTTRTKLVSFTQVSNALGTVTPAHEMIQMAHRAGAKVLLDGAQSVSHMQVDVQQLDPDFFVFSGHKVFGPTGIGALYGKPEVLADMPAWQGGGNMIQDVTYDKTIYHEAPAKFEAGTGNIADAVGLGAAIDYVQRLGMANIARYEHELLEYATAALLRVPGLRLIGTAKEKASVLSFTLHGFKSEEVGAALNSDGIAVRSGHHCAQPILRRFGVETTVRPSLAFYNTCGEVDVLLNSLLRLTSGKSVAGL